ncbi:MAG: hypothetical protein ACUVRS_01295 [Armatimonadota bacterium]
MHNRFQQTAYTNTCVAVNVGGVEVCAIEHGSILVQPGYLVLSTIIDTMVRILPESSRALNSSTKLKLHIGTIEPIGRVTLMQSETIMPGEIENTYTVD